MEWIYCKDRLPKNYDGTHFRYVLVCLNDMIRIPKLYLFHEKAADMDKLWFDGVTRQWVENNKIEAWMELPECPIPEFMKRTA